jgi:hypothetical protein
MLFGKYREPDLFRSPLPDEYLAALIRIRGPCSGEIHGICLFKEDQARQRRGSQSELEQPVHAISPYLSCFLGPDGP